MKISFNVAKKEVLPTARIMMKYKSYTSQSAKSGSLLEKVWVKVCFNSGLHLHVFDKDGDFYHKENIWTYCTFGVKKLEGISIPT